jgi:hypothetical protein
VVTGRLVDVSPCRHVDAALVTVFTSGATTALTDAGAPNPSGLASALSAGQAPEILASAPPQARAQPADVLSSGYVDGLRDVFLACGIGGIVGGLLVLWLVRAPAPTDAGQRPAEYAAPEPAAR